MGVAAIGDLDGNCIDDLFIGAYLSDESSASKDRGAGWSILLEALSGNPRDAVIKENTQLVAITEQPEFEQQSGTPTSLEGFESKMKIQVFPNPANDILNVMIVKQDKSDETTIIEIIDMLGNKVLSRKIEVGSEHLLSLDVATLSAGQYMVKVSTSKESRTSLISIMR